MKDTTTTHLKAGELYMGDGGRMMCSDLSCAGASASITGRDLSGHGVERVTDTDLEEWMQIASDLPLECDCGAVVKYSPDEDLDQ